LRDERVPFRIHGLRDVAVGADAADLTGADSKAPPFRVTGTLGSPDGLFDPIDGDLLEPTTLIPWLDELPLVVDKVGSRLYRLDPRGHVELVPLRGPVAGGGVTSFRGNEIPIVVERPAGADVVVLERTRLEPVWSLSNAPHGAEGIYPCSTAMLADGTLLVGHYDGEERDGGTILRFTAGGRRQPVWDPGLSKLLEPQALSVTDRGGILVAEPHRHVVYEITLRGAVTWSVGTLGQPGGGMRLSSPRDARVAGREVIVADSLNGRILAVARNGVSRSLVEGLALPWSTLRMGNTTLIADAGAGRVVAVSDDARVVQVWGAKARAPRLLSFPRSIHPWSAERFLVADTNNDRVVEVGVEDHRAVRVKGRLRWPRACRPARDGRLFVADGLNGRILLVGEGGAIHVEISTVRDGGISQSLGDPHDVRALSTGTILVTDGAENFVAEVDLSGRIKWSYGLPTGPGAGALKDPHQAHRLRDGATLIVDSLNHRLLLVDERGEVRRVVDHLSYGATSIPVHYPRAVCRWRRGWVIADGSSRLLLTNADFRVLAAIGPVIPARGGWIRLHRPARDLAAVDADRLAVCDHFKSRVLVLTTARARGEA
jgi:hypothetical protein